MLVRNQMITWQEIQGLSANLLVTRSATTGKTQLTDWAKQHAGSLGVRYASELAKLLPSFVHVPVVREVRGRRLVWI